MVSDDIVDDDVTASGHVTSVMTSTLLWLAHRPVDIGPWAYHSLIAHTIHSAQATVSKHVALRPQNRDGLLGTGRRGGGGGVKGGGGGRSEWLVRALRPSKDRGGRGPSPELTTTMLRQWGPRHCKATSVCTPLIAVLTAERSRVT